jgi:hypothetical protein
MNERPLDKKLAKTPAEIFRDIDNQSVNRKDGEDLIKRYGDRRAREESADLQEKMGIEITEEAGKILSRIELLIDGFLEKMINMNPPHEKECQ